MNVKGSVIKRPVGRPRKYQGNSVCQERNGGCGKGAHLYAKGLCKKCYQRHYNVANPPKRRKRRKLVGKCKRCGKYSQIACVSAWLCWACYRRKRIISGRLDREGICSICKGLQPIISVSDGLCRKCYDRRRRTTLSGECV